MELRGDNSFLTKVGRCEEESLLFFLAAWLAPFAVLMTWCCDRIRMESIPCDEGTTPFLLEAGCMTARAWLERQSVAATHGEICVGEAPRC